MARVPRSSLPPYGYFHVYARAVAAAGLLFLDDDDRRRFVRLLWDVVRQHAITCHAFCLMGTHYHLVLETQRESLSSGVHRLNWLYAAGFNERHDRFGHVFSERFSTRAIESEDYLFDACAYVLLNPIRAGLCNRVDEWPWSYSRYGRDLG
jgi:REP element-mobilizing transposase RayT